MWEWLLGSAVPHWPLPGRQAPGWPTLRALRRLLEVARSESGVTAAELATQIACSSLLARILDESEPDIRHVSKERIVFLFFAECAREGGNDSSVRMLSASRGEIRHSSASRSHLSRAGADAGFGQGCAARAGAESDVHSSHARCHHARSVRVRGLHSFARFG